MKAADCKFMYAVEVAGFHLGLLITWICRVATHLRMLPMKFITKVRSDVQVFTFERFLAFCEHIAIS